MNPRHTFWTLILGVMGCMALGLLYDDVPYFPIEVSRTVAGPVASKAFMFMALGSFLAYDWPKYSGWVGVSWAGFVLLAVVPDTVSVAGHMVGLGLMGVGALGLCWEKPPKGKIVALMISFYAVRVAAKVAVVAWRDTIPYITMEEFFEPWSLFAFIKERSLDIMFGRGPPPHPDTLLVFRLAALGQWGLLWSLAWMLLRHGWLGRPSGDARGPPTQKRS